MEPSFLQHWFSGLSGALSDMCEKDRETVFSRCGRACSDSYTKQVYIDEYALSENLEDFLKRLKNRFPELGYQIIHEDKTVIIKYHSCACDLVRSGYINSPLLCECSRQSLLYNWETILGEQAVTIELLQSILGGGDCCIFRINLS